MQGGAGVAGAALGEGDDRSRGSQEGARRGGYGPHGAHGANARQAARDCEHRHLLLRVGCPGGPRQRLVVVVVVVVRAGPNSCSSTRASVLSVGGGSRGGSRLGCPPSGTSGISKAGGRAARPGRYRRLPPRRQGHPRAAKALASAGHDGVERRRLRPSSGWLREPQAPRCLHPGQGATVDGLAIQDSVRLGAGGVGDGSAQRVDASRGGRVWAETHPSGVHLVEAPGREHGGRRRGGVAVVAGAIQPDLAPSQQHPARSLLPSSARQGPPRAEERPCHAGGALAPNAPGRRGVRRPVHRNGADRGGGRGPSGLGRRPRHERDGVVTRQPAGSHTGLGGLLLLPEPLQGQVRDASDGVLLRRGALGRGRRREGRGRRPGIPRRRANRGRRHRRQRSAPRRRLPRLHRRGSDLQGGGSEAAPGSRGHRRPAPAALARAGGAPCGASGRAVRARHHQHAAHLREPVLVLVRALEHHVDAPDVALHRGALEAQAVLVLPRDGEHVREPDGPVKLEQKQVQEGGARRRDDDRQEGRQQDVLQAAVNQVHGREDHSSDQDCDAGAQVGGLQRVVVELVPQARLRRQSGQLLQLPCAQAVDVPGSGPLAAAVVAAADDAPAPRPGLPAVRLGNVGLAQQPLALHLVEDGRGAPDGLLPLLAGPAPLPDPPHRAPHSKAPLGLGVVHAEHHHRAQRAPDPRQNAKRGARVGRLLRLGSRHRLRLRVLPHLAEADSRPSPGPAPARGAAARRGRPAPGPALGFAGGRSVQPAGRGGALGAGLGPRQQVLRVQPVTALLLSKFQEVLRERRSGEEGPVLDVRRVGDEQDEHGQRSGKEGLP
mmetsp:Transcript_19143/g.73240  ORF Transcript_19143/g.73240 Transcript_19143/m.73240 type:complete len:832 (+) Transcript_19143:867-3362(+)